MPKQPSHQLYSVTPHECVCNHRRRLPRAGLPPTRPAITRAAAGGLLLLLTLLSAGCASQGGSSAPLPPTPNLVAVSQWIDTAGQPAEAQLAALRNSDYRVVVNLSPSGTLGSVANEEQLLTGKGISYVHIPVDVNALDLMEFELFSAIMSQSHGRRVLVHCQVNRRASVFTFLYRVVHEKADPDEAFEQVTAVWVPQDQWLLFIDRVLGRYGIAFRP